MLSVTTPAADLQLLSAAELRAAIGVEDSSKDALLATIGLRVAAAIARACGIAAAGAEPPTLRQEALSETFRLDCPRARLMLARVPVASVTAATECGVALDAADYEIEAAAGLVRRLVDDTPSSWAAGKITVAYQAGWATVPDDLKLAASKLVMTLYAEGTRDPSLKRVTVPGVAEREYWVGPAEDPLIPAEVMDLLRPYRMRGIR